MGEGNSQFNLPKCFAVDKAGHLIVRVQVFELSGKFVTKLGSKGNCEGEFILPLSTAVLSDGRIVVSDFLNHCIQIFE